MFHICPNLPHYVWFLLVNVCALAACSPCTWKCVPLVDLLDGLLCAGQNGLPPTPDTLHLGCSYHLHSSHHFLSTWGAVMLKKKKDLKKRKKKKAALAAFQSWSNQHTTNHFRKLDSKIFCSRQASIS